MSKQEIVTQLNKFLAEVPELRKLNCANGEFSRWKNGVLKTLTDIYGSDSPQHKRFDDAPGKFFKVDTEFGRQQDYEFKLDCYESALKTLIQRAEMG